MTVLLKEEIACDFLMKEDALHSFSSSPDIQLPPFAEKHLFTE